MGWLIALLGTGLAIGGTIAIYFGAPYMQVEWGYSEVIAGTTALSAGILAVGLAAVLFALRDLRRAVTGGVLAPRQPAGRAVEPRVGARSEPDAPTRAVAPPSPTPDDRAEPALRDDEPALFRPPPGASLPLPDQAPTVVGRYEANGASYVLFSDGTIEVETETGTHRYASMQELRAHIEQQGGT